MSLYGPPVSVEGVHVQELSQTHPWNWAVGLAGVGDTEGSGDEVGSGVEEVGSGDEDAGGGEVLRRLRWASASRFESSPAT